MRTKVRETFTTVETEGAILPPDLLARLAEGDRELAGLDAASYHLAGETINEAVSRSWSRLQGVWAAFKGRRKDGELAAGTTRERWLLTLFSELGYGRLLQTPAVEIEGKTYPVSREWHNTPIHLVGTNTGLDERTPGVAGAARMSPHGMVQELLNRSEERLWAFVSNGLKLRILRDNASLTRQAYVEFDLVSMMDGEVYPDFVLLWLLCHQSRVEGARPEECYLERWSHAAAERGTRALDGLRDGVEQAISSLGSGFLSHRANGELRDRLRRGELSAQDYYRQLLRLVYRLLFLFVAEDRGLLLDPEAGETVRDRYSRYYSTRKLRDLAERRVGGRHPDLYRTLSIVMGGLGQETGRPELGLPALGGFLFDRGSTPDLEEAEISNRDLLDAVRALSTVEYDGAHRPVDYRNLGAEELGSVYESLLELHPELDASSGTFALSAAGGSERKTTGSYYTPHSLVNSLLDTALEPVLEEAARKPDPEKAILDLKVCDPAVGSGHFLISAAHRIARRLASVRTGDDEPSPARTREALREVIGNCLYGVDVNPMAVELCKVSLWMEALVPGMPLSFLDHHLQVGNSLLGATPELIEGGIPDDAFKPIEGDEKELTSAYRKRNRREREERDTGRFTPSLRTLDREQRDLGAAFARVEEAGDGSVAEVREKEERYREFRDSPELAHQRLLCAAFCAAFVWPKRHGAPDAITQETFAALTRDPGAIPRESREEVRCLAGQYGFFHWHLAYPNVFDEGGGFDVVLGNPPWERVKLQEQEWFAACHPEIAKAPNAAARKQLIKKLVTEDPEVHAAFQEGRRKADGENHLLRNSGFYPLCGHGDINTYAVFAELDRSLLNPQGRVGIVVPDTIATNKTTAPFFNDLVSSRALRSLYGFKNERFLFVGVEHTVTFALMTLGGTGIRFDEMEFCWLAWTIEEMLDESRRVKLSPEDIRLFNPNTRTCPTFRTVREAEITKSIYSRVPVLIDENDKDGNPWKASITRTFDMARFSGQARTYRQLLEEGFEHFGAKFVNDVSDWVPVYESKMMGQFDHRFATYAGCSDEAIAKGRPAALSEEDHRDPHLISMSRYWLPGGEVRRLTAWHSEPYWIAFRNVARSTDWRTTIATVLPRHCSDYSVRLCYGSHVKGPAAACLVVNLNSFVFDFTARQFVAGANLSDYITQQLPVLPPWTYKQPTPWATGHLLSDWTVPRVLELTYTAWDLEPFARDLGYDGPPFNWDPERRFLLRCELDAAYFHLYGIDRDDIDYIMDTFHVVKQKDEAAHGEYRTKRVILEVYDAMARAAETGEPYRSPLDLTGNQVSEMPPSPSDAASGTEAPTTRPEGSGGTGDSRESGVRIDANNPTQDQLQGLMEDILEGEDFSELPPEHRGDVAEPELAQQADIPDRTSQNEAEDEVPEQHSAGTADTEEAALALHACVPDGERVERDALLADAARELGHQKLTRQVRRRLNQALNAEHNAGRLRTDWERVWKPKGR